MRRLTLALALAPLAVITACGSDPESTPAAAPAAAPAASAAAGGSPAVLTASVGTKEEPDAFEIALTDAAGQPVESLPAGDYRIEVDDPSAIHNVHLTGGSVDETTTVPAVTRTTWDVTLAAGSYTFICDPHPRMVGTFTVT